MDCPQCNSELSNQSQEDLIDLSSILYQSPEKRTKLTDPNLMQKLGLTYDDLADLLPQEKVKPLIKSEPNPETLPYQVPVERMPTLSFSTNVSKDIIDDFNKETQFYQKSVQGTSKVHENEEPCAKCFQYLLDHEDYPLDDYEQVTVSIRSPSGNSEKRKRELFELRKDLKLYRESIPADAGLPLTTPRRSVIPKRPMSFGIERDMDLDSTPPLRFRPKKTSTPKRSCCHSNNPQIYSVYTPQESTPFRKVLKTSFADSKDLNTNKKSSSRFPVTDLRKSYNKKSGSVKKDLLNTKPLTKQPQKKRGKSPLTKKRSPVLTTILPKRPMERVVSEVFERRPEEVNCCLLVTSPIEAKPNAIENKPTFSLETCPHQNKNFDFDSSQSHSSNHFTSLHNWGDQTHEKKLDQHKTPITPNKENIVLIEYESNHERLPLPTLTEIVSNEVVEQVEKKPFFVITPERYAQKPEQIRQHKEVLKTKVQNSYKKLQDQQKKTNKPMPLPKTKKFNSNETTEDFHTPRSSFTDKSKSRRYEKPVPVKHSPLKKLKANSFSIAPFSYLPKNPPLYYQDQAFTIPKQRSVSSKNRRSLRFRCRSRPLMHIDSLTDISSTNILGDNVSHLKNPHLVTTTFLSKPKQFVQPVTISENQYSLRKSLDKQKKPGYTRSDERDSKVYSFGKRLSSPNNEPRRTNFKISKPWKLRKSMEKLNAVNTSKYRPRLLSHEKLMTNSFIKCKKTFAK